MGDYLQGDYTWRLHVWSAREGTMHRGDYMWTMSVERGLPRLSTGELYMEVAHMESREGTT